MVVLLSRSTQKDKKCYYANGMLRRQPFARLVVPSNAGGHTSHETRRISACSELLQFKHNRITENETKEKHGNSYAGRSAQHHKAGVIYSSASQLAVSSEDRLWPGPGERQSAGLKSCGQVEERKVLINVLHTQGPTVPWSSSAVLGHAVSYFWNEK